MTIKSMPLNKGEVCCCSKKAAKDIFADTDVILDFGCRNYSTFAHTPDAYYRMRNIKGRVLVSFYMTERYPNPMIHFHVIPVKENFSEELRKEAEEIYLPAFKRLYQKMKAFQNPIDFPLTHTKVMLLELLDGKLKLHEYQL